MVRVLLASLAAALAGEPADPPSIRVMTFNLWHGGDAGKQPLQRSADAILAAKADVVGFQETHGLAKEGPRPDQGRKIAELLGWTYVDQGGRTGIATRFKRIDVTPGKRGVRLEVAPGFRIAVFNVHLAHAPYQPYQLLKIPYADAPFLATEREAVEAARAARGAQVAAVLEELKALQEERIPVFLTGDFNEPSHLDWTERAVKAGACPLKVEFPSTRAIGDAGLRDAWRTAHPDEVGRRGNTWTPTTAPGDPKDRHDRIDFVFYSGALLRGCEIVGESPANADLVSIPWPSDHRAVVAEFTLPE